MKKFFQQNNFIKNKIILREEKKDKKHCFLPYYVYTPSFKRKSIKKTDITDVILLVVPTFSVIS